MNEIPAMEFERPIRERVAFAALRRHGDERAAVLRREVPVVLGRMLAEVPAAVLELTVRTRDDGVVAVALAAEAGAMTAPLLVEAALVLDQIAELRTDVEPAEPAIWPVVACAPSARLGFGAPSGHPLTVHQLIEALTPDYVGLVASHAGTGVRVRMRAAERAGTAGQAWQLDVAVLTAGSPPPLRLRAELRGQLGGLEIATDADAESVVLEVTAAQLPSVFAIPVAGERPVPGVYLGGSAAVPMQPSRDADEADGRSIRLGAAVSTAGHRVDVRIGGEERLRHVHVIGRTGTGKSTFLAGLAHGVAAGDDGILVLDPHGQLVDRIVAELPDSALARTWLVRCGDVDNPVPLNPLAETEVLRREIAIDDVCEMFQLLFDKRHTGIVGPRFRERVAMGLRALAAVHGPRATLLDVPTALSDETFMRAAVKAARDERLKAWLANESACQRSNEYGELVAWVNSKFEPFTSTSAMRAILGSGEDAIDLADAMDDGRIILVDLSKSALGESATRLLGYLYLNRTWISALRRSDVSRPFTVVVDEAQSLAAGAVSSMLSEGRKFGLSVVLAHQYLGQLDEDVRPAVDGNVATTVAFRGAVADCAELQRRFADRIGAPTLTMLPDLSAVILRSAAGVQAEPHTLTVDHNDRVAARTGLDLHRTLVGLERQRNRDLVDPFRDETAAAAAGRSKVTTAPPAAAPAGSKKPGFLDDWLANRAAAGDGEQ
ncbi:type IV secretory system conjugative DNA transfer family protein [Mycolicibacterium cosmeticum]|uniref:type IV secretory system conjugative DNA transfer family protein n=1 Tax=Mycolicibacterium cosmeticum TaxID=258533 RepID=UPI0032047D79